MVDFAKHLKRPQKPKDPIEHLAKLVCGHIQVFVKRPIPTWWEWCDQCKDFKKVIEGVSK